VPKAIGKLLIKPQTPAPLVFEKVGSLIIGAFAIPGVI
jgi:hypothetical protein